MACPMLTPHSEMPLYNGSNLCFSILLQNLYYKTVSKGYLSNYFFMKK